MVHTGKYRTEKNLKIEGTKTKHNTENNKQRKIQQNKTILQSIQSPFMALGQETRWDYSTMLPGTHVVTMREKIKCK